MLTAALMEPEEMLPEIAAQALERYLFENHVGRVRAADPHTYLVHGCEHGPGACQSSAEGLQQTVGCRCVT